MANQIFMRVNEVAEELGVSIPYAYKLIRQLNEGNWPKPGVSQFPGGLTASSSREVLRYKN